MGPYVGDDMVINEKETHKKIIDKKVANEKI
jgi:hypothetical protein